MQRKIQSLYNIEKSIPIKNRLEAQWAEPVSLTSCMIIIMLDILIMLCSDYYTRYINNALHRLFC
jgi:hypothetical protein